jgi:uncharacterized membrane protein
MHSVAVVTIVSSFLASAVEFVEAVTIVLAVGVTRQLRSALIGVAAAAVTLALLVTVFGTALALFVPISLLRLVVGGFLVIYGLQWLTKAVLRAGGARAKHDEAAIYAASVAARHDEPAVAASGMDWISFTVAFKASCWKGSRCVHRGHLRSERQPARAGGPRGGPGWRHGGGDRPGGPPAARAGP